MSATTRLIPALYELPVLLLLYIAFRLNLQVYLIQSNAFSSHVYFRSSGLVSVATQSPSVTTDHSTVQNTDRSGSVGATASYVAEPEVTLVTTSSCVGLTRSRTTYHTCRCPPGGARMGVGVSDTVSLAAMLDL